MNQFIKYLIIGLVAFIIGSVLGILIYRHFSKDPLPSLLTANVKTLEGKLPKDLQGGASDSSKKDDKKTEAPSSSPKDQDKTSPGKKEDASKSSSASQAKDSSGPSHASKETTPDAGKKDTSDSKKDSSENSDDSVEYLRALWPIKKRKAPDVSGGQNKGVYLDGTSPYGPPPSFKEDLFKDMDTLVVAGEPRPTPPPKPLTFYPKPSPPPQKNVNPSNFYQVQIGQFSSLEKARQARDLLREKGYPVDIYYEGSVLNPHWFYVRLSETFYKPQAYQKAQEIAVQEKIVPTLVDVPEPPKKIE